MKLHHFFCYVSIVMLIGCSPTLPDGESFDVKGTLWKRGNEYDRPTYCCGCNQRSRNGDGWFYRWGGDYYYNHDYHRIDRPWWYCTTCYELAVAIESWQEELGRLERKYARVKFDDQEKYLRKKVENARSYLNHYKDKFRRRGH